MGRLVIAAVILVSFTMALPANGAETRIALVIGNSAYANVPLANPANDARLMVATLRGLGFHVIEHINVDRKTMQLASFDLQDRLIEAGNDAVGLFYYAGHGVQVGGDNYLIPLNTSIEKEREVAIEAVSASFVLKQMEFAGNRVNFIILDACRNNPLTRNFRSEARGLARMDAPRGSLVAYSTGPGQVAADGVGFNSPYTLALTRIIQMNGVPAEKMFKLVRDRVMEAANGSQTPWEESSLTDADFYFAGAAVTAEAPTATATTTLDSGEQAFRQAIKDSADAYDYLAYLDAYPSGIYAALARARADALAKPSASQATRDASVTDLAFWNAVKDSSSAADYAAYLQQFPEGAFAPLAQVRLTAAEERAKEAASIEVAALTTQDQTPPAQSLLTETENYDGDWILDIFHHCDRSKGDTTEIKISDGAFSADFGLPGVGRGNITGQIDTHGMLSATGAGTAFIFLVSTPYENGSFQSVANYTKYKWTSLQHLPPFEIAMTRISTAVGAALVEEQPDDRSTAVAALDTQGQIQSTQ
ncbi:MAG: caspase family protein [Alphaproteobacteria bacterium]